MTLSTRDPRDIDPIVTRRVRRFCRLYYVGHLSQVVRLCKSAAVRLSLMLLVCLLLSIITPSRTSLLEGCASVTATPRVAPWTLLPRYMWHTCA